jgi:hypothetical protein
MNDFVVFTDQLGPNERYWDGDMTGTDSPCTTKKIDNAATFSTPREAYRAARDVSSLQRFRVGRRPIPINLKDLKR